jgi:hypothetical protein
VWSQTVKERDKAGYHLSFCKSSYKLYREGEVRYFVGLISQIKWVRFPPYATKENKFESLFGIVKKKYYLYIVNEKLIGDERYSVLNL